MKDTMEDVKVKNRYKAQYKIERCAQNRTFYSTDGFSAISFENIGDVDAVINSVIPCNNTGVARNFAEKPDTKITTDFTVSFDPSQSGTKAVIVIKTFYFEEA